MFMADEKLSTHTIALTPYFLTISCCTLAATSADLQPVLLHLAFFKSKFKFEVIAGFRLEIFLLYILKVLPSTVVLIANKQRGNHQLKK
jgi:hypothetical protein